MTLPAARSFDQFRSASRKSRSSNSFRRHPANFAKNAVFNFALVPAHFKEAEFDRTAARVFMTNAGDLITDLGLDSQFFFQFAAQSIARLFAFFDLAAGEFPLEWHQADGASSGRRESGHLSRSKQQLLSS